MQEKSTLQYKSLVTNSFLLQHFTIFPFLVMVCGRVTWLLEFQRIFSIYGSKQTHGINYLYFFFPFFLIWDNSKTDCDTKAIPNHSDKRAVQFNRKSGPFQHPPDLDGILYIFFFFNPCVHTKEKTLWQTTVSIFGAFTFWPAYKQSCAFFRKLEDEKTIKTRKKSLTPQLWRKSSHTGSWVSVVRRWWASWDAGHALAHQAFLLHVDVGG